MVPAPLRRLRRSVREGPSDAPGRVVDVLGRVGLVGYGVVHLVVAWLALHVAFGMPTAPADAQGAVGTIARSGGGSVVLALGAVGLLSFAVWQLAAAALGFRWTRGSERFRKRAGAVAKAIAVTALAALVIDYLVGKDSPRATTAQTSRPTSSCCRPGGSCSAWPPAGSSARGRDDLHRGAPHVHGRPRRAPARPWAAGSSGSARSGTWRAPRARGGRAAGRDGRPVRRPGPGRRAGRGAARARQTWLGASLLVVVASGFAAYGLFCFVDAATRRA